MLEYFNFRVIWQYLPLFLKGFLATGWISIISLAGALLIGILACVCRLSKSRFVSSPAVVYIEIVRSTPLLAQLYFFYFGLPSLGIRLTELQTGILALALNSGAYMAEIVRAGVQSIPVAAPALHHFTAGAGSHHSAAARTSHRTGQRQCTALTHICIRIDQSRPDYYFRAIHACRRVFHYGFLLPDFLLFIEIRGKLVAEAPDIS